MCIVRPARRGFTLVKILIVITLIAVVAGWAVSRFTNMNYRMDANIRMLQNTIIAAQQTAIGRSVPVQLMFDASSDSAMRVRILLDADDDGQVSLNETVTYRSLDGARFMAPATTIDATAGPLYVSGTVVGNVTLRVPGRVSIVDDLVYATPPNTPESDCTTQLGIVAVGDISVVDGLMTRTRRIARSSLSNSSFTEHLGGVTGIRLHGAFMSLTGTVGVEAPGTTMGASGSHPECPEVSGSSNRANGGCFRHVGSAVMRRFSPHYSGANTGFRYDGAPDRCQATTRRPPFFPLTNRYTHIRTLEVETGRANTPPEIRALLLRLKGKAL